MDHEHLSDERLSELGCGDASALCNGEAAHFAACPACQERLAGERLLAGRLSGLAAATRVPDGFAARARGRFEREMRARAARRIAWASAGLLAALAAWALVALGAADLVAVDVAHDVALVAALLRALATIGAVAPAAVAVGIFALVASAFAAAGGLFVLSRKPNERARFEEARCKEV